jgi:hypothetical protein
MLAIGDGSTIYDILGSAAAKIEMLAECASTRCCRRAEVRFQPHIPIRQHFAAGF